jgi:hypothetical protein
MKMRLAALFVVAACGPVVRAGVDAPVADDDDAATIPDAPPPMASGPVHVVITADNAYSFGYGDANAITHFTQGTRAQTAGQIFNCPIGEGPEVYEIPEAEAPADAFLYIVTWDDLAVTQGVLGQFTRDTGTVRTGDARFDVCATGIDFSTGPDALVGPSLAVINTEIARCNTGAGDAATTSKGWVNLGGPAIPGALGTLAVGEANDDQASTFPIVCQPTANTPGIESTAKWMWYDPHDGQAGDAFHSTGVNRFKAFLIFRLAAAVIF